MNDYVSADQLTEMRRAAEIAQIVGVPLELDATTGLALLDLVAELQRQLTDALVKLWERSES